MLTFASTVFVMATLKVPHQVGGLGDYLREQRETARLSLRQLAVVAGVSNPYLSQIERGLRRPSAEVLQQIAKGLQISAEALFLRAGFLEESGGLEVEVAIQSDARLTLRQRRVLLDIYATFRAENARPNLATSADETTGTADDEVGIDAETLKPVDVDVDQTSARAGQSARTAERADGRTGGRAGGRARATKTAKTAKTPGKAAATARRRTP
jgi:transcriptional regulator with XRE-family HTH domain